MNFLDVISSSFGCFLSILFILGMTFCLNVLNGFFLLITSLSHNLTSIIDVILPTIRYSVRHTTNVLLELRDSENWSGFEHLQSGTNSHIRFAIPSQHLTNFSFFLSNSDMFSWAVHKTRINDWLCLFWLKTQFGTRNKK